MSESQSAPQKTVAQLLAQDGETYAHQAGIHLKDEPAPLFQLLVLANLLSTRISADIAVDAARELNKAGFTTAQHMKDASWQQRVDALGRGHYRRYDESTATRLGEGAELLLEKYHGDLRRLHEAASSHSDLERRLEEFPGIGPTGAQIFLREVQGVWSDVGPVFDKKALQGAKQEKLPTDPQALGNLAPRADWPRLAAALVRVTLKK